MKKHKSFCWEKYTAKLSEEEKKFSLLLLSLPLSLMAACSHARADIKVGRVSLCVGQDQQHGGRAGGGSSCEQKERGRERREREHIYSG